jgi:uncharacterized protein (TIGR02679 family)
MGWLARIAAHPDPLRLIAQATDVLAALPEPGRRLDRRTLVATDPHALDDGTVLSGFVLALVDAAGMKKRDAWDRLGIDCDDLTGGLLALGLQPDGWSLPPDAVVTIPPRELARCAWPSPPVPGTWAFVTENPSVIAAAATSAICTAVPIRLLCTVGTPSALEATIIAALANVGWQVAVRADFDVAGLAHVRTLLAACPRARPWRMGALDYTRSANVVEVETPLRVMRADTPWDISLADAMTTFGAPAYEEALLPDLLTDLTRGRPLT